MAGIAPTLPAEPRGGGRAAAYPAAHSAAYPPNEEAMSRERALPPAAYAAMDAQTRAARARAAAQVRNTDRGS